MRHRVEKPRFVSAIALSLSVVGCCVSPQTPIVPISAPQSSPPSVSSTCPPARAEETLNVARSSLTKFWNMCVYERSVAAADAADYFTLKLYIEEGDSELNGDNDVSARKKLRSSFDKQINTAAVTLKMGGSSTLSGAPETPILGVARSSDGSNPVALNSVNGADLLPYSRLSSPMAQWGFVMNYRLGEKDENKVLGGIIEAAQQALRTYPVGGIVGAVLKEPSAGLPDKVNKFVSDLYTTAYSPQETKFMSDMDEWKKIAAIRLEFYDASLGKGDRKVVAKVVLVPSFKFSVYAGKLNAGGKPDYEKVAGSGTFGTAYEAIGGSTKDAFQKIAPTLSAQMPINNASVFSDICLQGPGIYSSNQINLVSTTDAVFATWLTLINSKSWTSQDSTCPTLVDQFKELELPLFPAATAPKEQKVEERKANTAQTIVKTIPVKNALNNAAKNVDNDGSGSGDLPANSFAASVWVRQEIEAIPGIPVKGIYSYSADDFFAKLKAAGAVFVGKMYFDGKPSTVVKMALSVGDKKYNSELQWESLEPDAKIKAFFITGQTTTGTQ